MMPKSWKYYVYRFDSPTACIYVGKGCGRRFDIQRKRFTEYRGHIVAYFKTEQDAFTHELSLIKQLAPAVNKTGNQGMKEPWIHILIPDSTTEFYAWCEALGTRQMAIRAVLSRDWNALRGLGVDIKMLLSKLDPWCGRLDGLRA